MNTATSYSLQYLLRQLKIKSQLSLRQLRRLAKVAITVNQGFYIAFKGGALSNPGNPDNIWMVKSVCRRLCDALDIEVTLHGVMPNQQALWVANHISWLDVPVIGSQTKVFFLAKAEIQHWPVIGRLAQAGGTLFIKRGSGDSTVVKEQISGFLNQKTPVIFFPEATTTDGSQIKRLHGKLLAAAIATNTPIQPLILAYVNNHGQLDSVVPFINDDTFGQHLIQVLSLAKIHAHILPLPAISSSGHDIESLTRLLQREMSQGLAQLHQQVLCNPV